MFRTLLGMIIATTLSLGLTQQSVAAGEIVFITEVKPGQKVTDTEPGLYPLVFGAGAIPIAHMHAVIQEANGDVSAIIIAYSRARIRPEIEVAIPRHQIRTSDGDNNAGIQYLELNITFEELRRAPSLRRSAR